MIDVLRPWRKWPMERPPDRTIRLMRSAYEAYVGIAWCRLTPEGRERVLAEFECPGEGWGCTRDELDVAAMVHRAWLCADAV